MLDQPINQSINQSRFFKVA